MVLVPITARYNLHRQTDKQSNKAAANALNSENSVVKGNRKKSFLFSGRATAFFSMIFREVMECGVNKKTY